MYQGDIKLTPEQQQLLSAVAVDLELTGYHVYNGFNPFGSVTYGRWSGGKIPYQIERSIGE